MSPTPLQVLILEDSRSDTLLMVREMRQGGFEVEYTRVQTAADLEAALEGSEWDLILSDFSMPAFNASEALTIVRREKNMDIPFIIVSGAIGEEAAVKAMKAGANDFFPKGKLTRLAPAIERELQEAEERRRRRRAEAQLRKTEERFAKAFQASPVAIAISRLSDGELLAVNPRFVEVFGYKGREIIGKTGSELALWTSQEQRHALIERLRRSETLQNVEVDLRHASGKIVHTLLSAEVIELDNEPCILSFVQDVTELRRRQEEILETKNLLEKTFAGLSEAVFIINPAGRRILMCNAAVEEIFGYRPEELIGESTRLLHLNQEMYERFSEAGDPVLQNGRSFHTEYRMRRKDGDVIDTENTVAILDEEKGFRAGVVSVVRDITKRKEAEERIRRANERIGLLRDVAVAANEATEVNEILQFVIDEVCAYTGWEIGHAYLGQAEGGADLHSTSIWYLSDEEGPGLDEFRRFTEKSYVVAGEGLVRKVVETKRPQWLGDVGDSPEFVRAEAARAGGLRAGYAMPILAQNRIMGVLEFFSRRAPDEVAGEVIDVSVHIGAQVGRAIERQWAAEKVERYTERLELLHEIDRAILNIEAPGVIAQNALRQLGGMISFHSASVITLDLEKEEATFLALESEGDSVYEVGQTVPLENKTAVSLLRENRPYVVHDTAQAELTEGEKLLVADGVRSYITAPLLSGDKLWGAMTIRAAKPHVFSSDTIEIMMEVAAQLAIALYNADLYRQVQQYARELEQRVAARTAELQHQKERIETILRSSSDAILLLDQDGAILRANRAFHLLFDYDDEAAVGQSFSQVARVAQATRLQTALQQVPARRSSQRIELTARKPDGKQFEMEAVLSPVEDDEDGRREIVCSLRDITARKQAEAELRRALQREKELNELKSSFTSMISHEFRTPLAVIKVSTDILGFLQRVDEGAGRRRLQIIDQQVDRLTQLMDDVLLFSRGERAGLTFAPAHIDLDTLCRSIIKEVKTAYGANRVVDFQYEGECHRRYIDEHLFQHILQNLLSNALKYSSAHSSVEVRVTCTEQETILLVRDEGMGMPETYRRNLFKPFHRAKNVGSIEGTGLGLAIVKQAVEGHGGAISVDSVEGEGASFTVTLPNG